jgi:hypothetical protein
MGNGKAEVDSTIIGEAQNKDTFSEEFISHHTYIYN